MSVEAAQVAASVDGGAREAEPAAGRADPWRPAPAPADAAHSSGTGTVRQREVFACRQYGSHFTQTPIFDAMCAQWRGPALDMVMDRVARAEAHTLVMNALPLLSGESARPAFTLRLVGDRRAPRLVVVGRLRTADAARLAGAVRDVLRAGPRRVTVDVTGVVAFTPGGVRALADFIDDLTREGLDVRLFAPKPPLRQALIAAGWSGLSAGARAARAVSRESADAPDPADGADAEPPVVTGRVLSRRLVAVLARDHGHKRERTEPGAHAAKHHVLRLSTRERPTG